MHMRQRMHVKTSIFAGLTGAAVFGTCALLGDQISLYERRAADAYQKIRGVEAPISDIIIVAIDDFSLNQAANSDLSSNTTLKNLGAWPWPRHYHGLAIRKLLAAGANVIAVDLLFDSYSSYGTADDESLASSIRTSPERIILGSYVSESKGSVAGYSLNTPNKILLSALAPNSIGLLNAHLDPDGNIRRRPSDYSQDIATRIHGQGVTSLSEAVLTRVTGKFDLPDKTEGSQTLLSFYGPPRTFQTIPIWQVLEENSFSELQRKQTFKDKIVLIGPTALSMQDLHRTAFTQHEGMPGVEIHATEIANRIEQKGIQWEPMDNNWALCLAALLLAFHLALSKIERPLIRLAWTLALTLASFVSGYIVIAFLGFGLRLATLSGFLLLAGSASTIEATANLQLNRWKLRKYLERYLSPAVALELVKQEGRPEQLLRGQAANVVVMMTDIRGFTSFTNTMAMQGNAEEVVSRLNQYFSKVVEAAHRHGGTVDKFIGDAALIIFGAPLNRGDEVEARMAIECALDICKALEELNAGWQSVGLTPWTQVIAMSFGEVISGNIGSTARADYTVIGDAVNTTSRLENIAKEAQREIVLSEPLARLLGDDPRIIDLGLKSLRGQGEARVYALDR